MAQNVSCTNQTPSIDFGTPTGGNGNYYYCITSGNLVSANISQQWSYGAGYWTSQGVYHYAGNAVPNPFRYKEVVLSNLGYPEEETSRDAVIRFTVDYNGISSTSRGIVKVYGYDAGGNVLYNKTVNLYAGSGTVKVNSGRLNNLHRVRVELFSGKSVNGNIYGGYGSGSFANPDLNIYFTSTQNPRPVLPGSYTCAVLEQNLLFNCSSGNQTVTVSQENMNALLSVTKMLEDTTVCFGDTVLFAPPKVSKPPFSALSFDGVDDYVDLRNIRSRLKQSNYSFAAWVKITGNSSGMLLGVNNYGGNNNYLLFINSSGKLTIYDTSGTYSGNTSLHDGNWHFVSMTFDAAADAAKLYVDGALQVSASMNLEIAYNDQISIGQEFDGINTSDHLAFKLGPAYFWNAELDTAALNDYRWTLDVSAAANNTNLIAAYNLQPGCSGAYMPDTRNGLHGIFRSGNTRFAGPGYVTSTSDTIPGFDYIATPSVSWYVDGSLAYNGTPFAYKHNSTSTRNVSVLVERQGMVLVRDTAAVNNLGGWVDLGSDIVLCFPDTASIGPSSTYSSYSWSTGETSQTIAVSQPGSYTITITDSYGCTGTDVINVQQETLEIPYKSYLDFPNYGYCINTKLEYGAKPFVNNANYDWDDRSEITSIADSMSGDFSITFFLQMDNDYRCFGSSHTCYENYSYYACNNFRDYNRTRDCSYRDIVSLESADGSAKRFVAQFFTPLHLNVYSSSVGSDGGAWNTSNTIVTFTSPYSSSYWSLYHFTITYESSTNQLKVYRNGSLVMTQTIPMSVASTDKLIFANGIEATVSELGIYSRVLSASEIQHLRNNAPDNDFSGYGSLVAFYDYSSECVSSTIFKDSHINGFNGTHWDGTSPTRGNTISSGVVLPNYDNLGRMTFEWRADTSVISTEDTLRISAQKSQTYFYTARLGHSEYRDSFHIDVTGIDINLGNDTGICASDAPLIKLLGNALSGGSFTWENGSNNPYREISTSGTYHAASYFMGCIDRDTFSVTVHDNPTPDIDAPGTLCAGEVTTISVDSTYSSVVWSNGYTGHALNATSGNFAVTVTDQHGCEGSDSITIASAPEPSVDLGPDTALCESQTPYTLLAGNSGTFTWSTGAFTGGIQVQSSGVYWVTRGNIYNCVNSDTVHITVYDEPEISMASSVEVCEDSALQLNPGNEFMTYAWSTGDTSSAVAPATSGVYTVTLTDSNGCVQSATSQVTIHPLPVVNLGADTAFCESLGPITYQAPSGGSNLWSNGSTSSQVQVSQSQTLWLRKTTPAGCSAADTVSIVIHDQPQVDLPVALSVCADSSVTLDAGTQDHYLWSTGDTSATISPVSSGTYAVTVVSDEGCSDSASSQVTIHPLPVVNLGPDTAICYSEGPLTYTAGNSGVYQWNTGSTLPYIIVNSTGIYSVVKQNTYGCIAKDTVSVIVYTNPVPELGPAIVACSDSSIVLYPGVFAAYSWSNGATDSTIAPMTSGVYSVTVSDSNGCQGTDFTSVQFYPVPATNLGSDTALCESSAPYVLNAGNSGYFLWNNGTFNNSLMIYSSGTYWVKRTNLFGCSSSDTVVVTVWGDPVPELGSDTAFCEGETIWLYPGDFPFYTWSNGSMNDSVQAVVNGMYAVTVTDSNGCSGEDQVAIDIIDLPVVDLGPDTAICADMAPYVLQTNSDGSHLWNTGDITNTLSVHSSGHYWVMVSNSFGCVNTDSVMVDVNPLPQPQLGNDIEYCGDTTIMLSPGVFAGYVWSDSTTSTQLTVTESGIYRVTVTDLNGCINSDEISVQLYEQFHLSLGNDTTVCLDESFWIVPVISSSSSGFYSYLWQNGSSGPAFYHPAAKLGSKMVWLKVTNQNGCADSAAMNVSVENCLGIAEDNNAMQVRVMPNPFNDAATIVLSKLPSSPVMITIFDSGGRIVGQMVENSQQINLEGVHLSQGVYTVVLKSDEFSDELRVVKL
ncbi:MAG: hypothetical protein Kow0075_03130 [Salibacteraceae bacterium]